MKINSVSKNGESSILWAISGSQQPNWIYGNVKIGQSYERGWRVIIDALPNVNSDTIFS